MDKSTGSPPDFFDPNGQNWGFPTYNWEAMAEEDYVWWVEPWVLALGLSLTTDQS
jgi:4-alpha-glucanotransferase